jgi:hypothetical protein
MTRIIRPTNGFKEGNVIIIFTTFINSVAFLSAVLQLNARKLHTCETAGG